MEDCKKKKLGAGIWIISIIQLLSGVWGLISSIKLVNNLKSNPEITQIYETIGIEINQTTLIIGSILSSILLIGIILILFKKSLGIYIYFLSTILSLIFSIINYISSPMMLIGSVVGLILPILMAIFIYRRRAVFNIGTKCANA